MKCIHIKLANYDYFNRKSLEKPRENDNVKKLSCKMPVTGIKYVQIGMIDVLFVCIHIRGGNRWDTMNGSLKGN